MKGPEDNSFLVALDNGLLTITFNRPDAGNAIPPQNVPLLAEVFEQAQAQDSVRAILVQAAGRVFSAGGDVANFARTLDEPVGERQQQFRERLDRASRLVRAVLGFERPLVVAMRGAAAGAGLLYPLAADAVIADENASFVFAHQRVGLSPDAGVSYLLPHVVGARRARNLFLTTARVNAGKALEYGLVTDLVATDDFDERVAKVATAMSRVPATAAVLAKRLANSAPTAELDAHLDAERDAIVACVGTEDFGEGVRAALEKRAPRFGG